jgi:hypothetical protein
LARTWRDIGASLWRRGKQFFPIVLSGALITWLVWHITPQRLLEAFAEVDWPWLVVATAVQVIVLFLWDSVCVWWLFSQPDRPLSWRKVLRIRCDTVIWSAINLEIGQGAFAWQLAKECAMPVSGTLSRCVLLSLFDMAALLGLALTGSFVRSTPITAQLRWVCVGGLAALLLLAIVLKLLPSRWRDWLAAKPWAGWLGWFDWRRGVVLYTLRLIMFLLVVAYAGVGLAICRVPVDVPTVVGIIPFVMLAESLPGTAGLGERETALVYLYPAGDQYTAVLLSFGLVWSIVVILGRVTIGLASWYLPHPKSAAEEGQCPASTGQSPHAASHA